MQYIGANVYVYMMEYIWAFDMGYGDLIDGVGVLDMEI